MDPLISDKLRTSMCSLEDRNALDKLEKKLTRCYKTDAKRHIGKCLENYECENWLGNNECPKECGVGCGNRRIINGWKPPPLRLSHSSEKGLCVLAARKIPKDTFILEYVGEIKREKDYKKECFDNPKMHFYAMELEKDWVIDASVMGNWSRYFNHSCMPNLRLEQWRTDDGLPRLILVSNNEILPQTELCFDYNFKHFKGTKKMNCKCGKESCFYNPRPRKRPAKQTDVIRCRICAREFNRRNNLDRHMITHPQADVVLFSCRICKKEFTRNDVKLRHERGHANEKPFPCEICDRKFRQKPHLKSHMKTHQEKRLIQCGILENGFKKCPISLKSESGIKAHRRRHHP